MMSDLPCVYIYHWLAPSLSNNDTTFGIPLFESTHLKYPFNHCKERKVVLAQFSYFSFLLLVCCVKRSGVSLPALDSKLDLVFQIISKCHGRTLG